LIFGKEEFSIIDSTTANSSGCISLDAEKEKTVDDRFNESELIAMNLTRCLETENWDLSMQQNEIDRYEFHMMLEGKEFRIIISRNMNETLNRSWQNRTHDHQGEFTSGKGQQECFKGVAEELSF
jgi:hypothetical protein